MQLKTFKPFDLEYTHDHLAIRGPHDTDHATQASVGASLCAEHTGRKPTQVHQVGMLTLTGHTLTFVAFEPDLCFGAHCGEFSVGVPIHDPQTLCGFQKFLRRSWDRGL